MYMNHLYNLSDIEAGFREFLILETVAPITLRNYMSDIRHFFGWTMQELRINNIEFKIEGIDSDFITAYCLSLSKNNTPTKTINRRLSTLRKFFSFCISQGWATHNPAKKVTNISSIHHQTDPITKPILSENELLVAYSQQLTNFKLSEKEITQINTDLKEFFTIINFPQRGT